MTWLQALVRSCKMYQFGRGHCLLYGDETSQSFLRLRTGLMSGVKFVMFAAVECRLLLPEIEFYCGGEVLNCSPQSTPRAQQPECMSAKY